MSRSDYERPADYQINRFYTCAQCGDEREYPNDVRSSFPCMDCGGAMQFSGESYPSNADDWDEVLDGNDWRNKNDLP